MVIITMYYGGLSFHDHPINKDNYSSNLPQWIFFLMAFSIQWFSGFDTLDGLRARRLKCGTPIGRLVDEAGDPFQYTAIALLLGFVFKSTPGFHSLCIFTINLPQYCMEIEYIYTGTLIMD